MKKILLNKKGLTLVELMVAMAITVILSLFTFESVRQVIMTSITTERKADFEALAADIRILVHKLDQCTCNFQGLVWNGTSATISLKGTPTLSRYSNAANGFANCTAPILTVAKQGVVQYKSTVTSLQLVDVQYISPLHVMRAILRMQASVPQQLVALPTIVTRDYPLLLSMAPLSYTTIRGCVGLSP